MYNVVLVTAAEAMELAAVLTDADFEARIGIDDEGVKVSIDRQTWTLGWGRVQS